VSQEQTIHEPPALHIGQRVRDRQSGDKGTVIDISHWSDEDQDHLVPVAFDNGEEFNVGMRLLVIEPTAEQPQPAHRQAVVVYAGDPMTAEGQSCIWGLGATNDAALADARRWIQDTDGATDEGLQCAPADEALADYIGREGTPPHGQWSLRDGRAVLVPPPWAGTSAQEEAPPVESVSDDTPPPPEEAPDIPAADEATEAPEPVHQVVQGEASEVEALRERDSQLRALAKVHRDLRTQAADLQTELNGLRQRMKDITQRMEDLAIDQVQTRFLSADGTVESEVADLFQGQDGDDDAGDVDPEAETQRIERADDADQAERRVSLADLGGTVEELDASYRSAPPSDVDAPAKVTVVDRPDRAYLVVDCVDDEQGDGDIYSLAPLYTRDEWQQLHGEAIGGTLRGPADGLQTYVEAHGRLAGVEVKVGRRIMVVGPDGDWLSVAVPAGEE
jgi:hypothetical protein